MQTYKELSDIYAELGQPEKSFEFRMLAALLNNRTTAEEWDEIAEMAKHFNRLELTVACLAKGGAEKTYYRGELPPSRNKFKKFFRGSGEEGEKKLNNEANIR